MKFTFLKPCLSSQLSGTKCTLLCHHNHCRFPEVFSHPKQELCTHETVTPHLPRPLPLLSVSRNLPSLGTSDKWNHTVFAILLLAYFM